MTARRSPLVAPAAIALSAIACGYAVATPHGLAVVAVACAIAAFAAVAMVNRGAGIALLVVAVLNGIPFIDLAELAIPTSFKPDDALLVLLLGLILMWAFRDGVIWNRATRFMVWWGAAFVLWWLVTFVRSTLFDQVSYLQAALYGRDFLYFGLLVPALATLKWTRRELIGLACVLAGATIVYATAATLSTITGAGLEFITHPSSTGVTEGLRRIYSPMNDLVVLSLAIGIGLAMVAPNQQLKRIGIGLSALMGLALAVQLTRALYVSSIIAFTLTTVLWIVQNDSLARRIRRRSLGVVLGIGLIAIALTYAGPSTFGGGAVGAVVNRATSGITEVKSNTGDFGYRVDIANRMADVLGSEWPAGLGFLHPSQHYEPDLPDGSIRNSDLGVSNVIMTMGAIGAILLYLPIIYAIVMLQRRRRFATGTAAAISFGIVGCLFVNLIDSPTLATLFNVSGLTLVALILGVAVRLVSTPRSSPI
jgi:hypothetical protein